MAEHERPIDADNHYYEPLDAFTRHLDPAFGAGACRSCSDGKRTRSLVGGKGNRFIPNPTFDPIIVPGCIDLLFRGQIPEGVDPRSAACRSSRSGAEYQDRDARLQVMDEQGLDAIVLFPTLGCGVEQALARHPRHDGQPVGLQLVARGGLGLHLRGPDHRRPDALARRPRCRAWSSSTACSPPAPGSCTSAPRRCRRANGTAARSAIRSTTRSGPASPRPASRSPSTSATAATTPSRRRGADARVRAFGRTDPLEQDPRRPTAPSTTRWRSLIVARRLQPPPRRSASPASRTAPTGCPAGEAPRKQANQTPWDFAEDRSTRCAATCGSRLLRGGPQRARRHHRRRAHPVRLRLAPRRGSRRPAGFTKELADDHGFDQHEIDLVMRCQQHGAARPPGPRHPPGTFNPIAPPAIPTSVLVNARVHVTGDLHPGTQ